ncbi:MAG: choice-of-anchor D domain-containing protein [Anaerolineae bacterium]|nr:choice-of-anchor D domain-containing protein [Anaerolineae bacterium]
MKSRATFKTPLCKALSWLTVAVMLLTLLPPPPAGPGTAVVMAGSFPERNSQPSSIQNDRLAGGLSFGLALTGTMGSPPTVLRRQPLDVAALSAPGPTTAAQALAMGWPQITVTQSRPPDDVMRLWPDGSGSQKGLEVLSAPEPASRAQIQAAVRAQATQPLLAVSPEYLHFTGQPGDSSARTQTLHIRNRGVGTLIYALSEQIAWLSLSSTSGSVPAGASNDIVVTVNPGGLPAASSPYSGSIVVDNVGQAGDREWIHVQLFVDAMNGYSALYSYSAEGSLQRQIRPDGSTIDYEYDSLNRLTRIVYPDGMSVSYAYDAVGNRVAMTDTWGTTYYQYDDWSRLTAVHFPGLDPVQYAYDNAHNLTQITYPDGRQVAYDYDGNSRLIRVSDAAGTTTYTYDSASGLLATKTLPNGLYTAYTYDADGRLTGVANRRANHSLISSYTYTLDANGNRTAAETQTPSGAETTTYGYDELYRLSRVTYPDGRTVSYTYDPLGNRLTMTDSAGGVTRYTYDADNRLLRAGDETFTYDANGNTIRRSSPGRTIDYEYDYENRLTRYDDGETAIEFVYDGDGNRVAKIVDGVRTNYVNDVNGWLTQVLIEADAGWSVDKAYTIGLDRVNQTDGTGKSSFYLYDSPLRSVTALVNSAGTLLDSYEYDAFGAPLASAVGGANSFLFNGEQYDAEIDLTYLRNRYYDPMLGRFLTADPLRGAVAHPQTTNSYIYAVNDPVNSTDPSGLVLEWFWDDQNQRSEHRGEAVSYLEFINYARGKTLADLQHEIDRGGKSSVSAGGPDYSYRFVQDPANPNNIIDMRHFLVVGPKGETFGLAVELMQSLGGDLESAYNAQDFYSNALGRDFYWSHYLNPFVSGDFSDRLEQFFTSRARDSDQSVGSRPTTWDSGNRSYWPPPPPPGSGGAFGGVSLDLTADLLLNIEDIAGATYDPKTGQIVFYGQEDVTLPPMDMDDLAVAFHSVYGNQDPGVSIGTEPSGIPGEMKVRYDGQTAETYFGYVMFEADRVLKSLSMGKDNLTGAPVTCAVPGYKSMLQRELESGECTPGESSNRMWFRPKEVRLVRSADGISMVFDAVSIEVLSESKFEGGVVGDPEAEAFAAHFTEHYDEFAAEFPILQELERLGKIVAVVKWIRDNAIPMDVSFLDNYVVSWYDTDEYTPETTVSDSSASCTIVFTGGVTYRPDPEYQADAAGDPLTGGMREAALASRPQETDFMWAFGAPPGVQALGVFPVEADFVAIAQSIARRRKDGNFVLQQTDMVYPVEGDLALHFTRTYDSFWDEPSAFGDGWTETPYQLLFPTYMHTYTFGGAVTKAVYPQIMVIDRPSGRQDVYDLYGLDGSKRALYVPADGSAFLRDNDDRSFTLLKKDDTAIGFDDAGRLIGMIDRNGNQILYAYSDDRLVRIYQPGGRQINLSYDGNRRIIRATGPGGRTVAYTYDANARLHTATNVAAGQTVTYTYDQAGYLARAVDNLGNVIFEQTVDIYGRSSGQTWGGEADLDFAYSLSSQQTVITDPNGNQTHRAFDDLYRLVSSVDPLSNTVSIDYAGHYGPGVVTTTQGARTQIFYDARDNVIAFLDDQGNLIHFFYDAGDNPIALRDPRGVDLFFEYDANSNLVAIYHEVTLVLDDDGNLVSLFYNPTNITELAYDGSGNLLSITDPEGNIRRFAHDANGVITSITEDSGLQANLQYDALSRLTRVSHGGGQTVAFGYDAADNVVSITTDGGTVGYAYDGNNNLTTVTDAAGNPPTRFSYDARANLTQVVDAGGGTASYAYDVLGNLVSAALPNNTGQRYDYDELNRLVRVFTGIRVFDLALSTTDLAFGPVAPGGSATRVVSLSNHGIADLVIERIAIDGPAFRVAFGGAVTLGAGETAHLTVTFAPTVTGMQSGRITIESSDPYQGTQVVDVSGVGIYLAYLPGVFKNWRHK